MDGNKHSGVSPVTSASELDAIGELLDDLEIESIADGAIEELIEEVIEEAPELNADTEQHLEAAIERIEAYEGAEAPEAPAMTEEAVVEALTAVPVVKAARVAKPASPKVERNLSALPADAFVLSTDTPADLEANKVAVMKARPIQKKVAEKFDNLLLSIAQGRHPSSYVTDLFAILDVKKTVTGSELVAGLRATPIKRATGGKSAGEFYNEGTARSQAGQIMALFPLLGIATRSGHTLTLNDKSTFAASLRSIVGGAA